MNCPDETALHDLIDDELDERSRARLEAHLAVCARCREESASIRSLVAEAAALPRSIDPTRNLWPAVRAGVDRAGRPSSGRVVRWVAAAAAVVLLAGAWVVLDRRNTGERAAAPAAELDGGDELARLSQAYLDATGRLLVALEARGHRLREEDRAELQRSLSVIDRAIDEVRLTGLDEDDPARQRTLQALYRQRLDAMWRASRLTS